jgi:hypothetical protein
MKIAQGEAGADAKAKPWERVPTNPPRPVGSPRNSHQQTKHQGTASAVPSKFVSGYGFSRAEQGKENDRGL